MFPQCPAKSIDTFPQAGHSSFSVTVLPPLVESKTIESDPDHDLNDWSISRAPNNMDD